MKRNAGGAKILFCNFLLPPLRLPFMVPLLHIPFMSCWNLACTHIHMQINRVQPSSKRSHNHTGLCCRNRAGECDSIRNVLRLDDCSREPEPSWAPLPQSASTTREQKIEKCMKLIWSIWSVVFVEIGLCVFICIRSLHSATMWTRNNHPQLKFMSLLIFLHIRVDQMLSNCAARERWKRRMDTSELKGTGSYYCSLSNWSAHSLWRQLSYFK